MPLTRVEKVDENPSHGEIPGTSAFEIREQDAIPDEIEVIPEGSRSRSSSTAGHLPRSSTPGGSPVPRTVVEKVDVDQPSHGDIPGTAAYEQRKADAVPDVVMQASDADSRSQSSPDSNRQAPTDANTSDMNVPETVLSKVDSLPGEDTAAAPHAHQRRSSDALPDATEVVADAPGTSAYGALTRSMCRSD